MPEHEESRSNNWKLFPWLVGVALAPLLFGSVNPPQQAIIGALFAASLLCTVLELSAYPARQKWVTIAWAVVIFTAVLLPLLPLPIGLVQFISPERAALGREFPTDSTAPTRFLTLSISPAESLQRAWEIALVLASFFLARLAGRRRLDNAFAVTLCVALLALACSELWYREYGWAGAKLLGLWPDRFRHAAGTFANRNHFADWVYVAGFFVLGWLVHLAGLTRGQHGRRTATWKLALGFASVAFAIWMALSCGSRGGMAAFAVGLVTVLLLMRLGARASANKTAFLVLILVLAGIFLLASEQAISRFSSGANLGFKKAIWRDALRFSVRFPVTGTGLGTFATAFTHYKTFAPHSDFLAAENEPVQLIAETGFLTSTLVLVLVAMALGRLLFFSWNARYPEIVFGGLGALAAFFFHSLVEFVFQIPATAILAVSIFGFLYGILDRQEHPADPPPPRSARVLINIICGLALLGLSALEGAAWLHWRAALHASSPRVAADEFAKSLALWPGNPERDRAFDSLALLAATATKVPGQGQPFGSSALARMLRLDPMNWRLRFATFPVRSTADPADAPAEAWRIVQLNPQQSALPLYFAHLFASIAPEQAVKFTRAAAGLPDSLLEALNLAWQLQPGGALLWKIVPNNDAALRQLGYFALGKGMTQMAVAAFERVSTNAPASLRAEDLLNAAQPEMALQLLTGGSPRENYLRSRAYLALHRNVEAMHAAEAVWVGSGFEAELLLPATPLSSASGLKPEALRAEEIFKQPAAQRDLESLRKLAATTGSPRIRWMVFQTERDRALFGEAAKTALDLARQALQRWSPSE